MLRNLLRDSTSFIHLFLMIFFLFFFNKCNQLLTMEKPYQHEGALVKCILYDPLADERTRKDSGGATLQLGRRDRLSHQHPGRPGEQFAIQDAKHSGKRKYLISYFLTLFGALFFFFFPRKCFQIVSLNDWFIISPRLCRHSMVYLHNTASTLNCIT